jgi:hypothetical protein
MPVPLYPFVHTNHKMLLFTVGTASNSKKLKRCPLQRLPDFGSDKHPIDRLLETRLKVTATQCVNKHKKLRKCWFNQHSENLIRFRPSKSPSLKNKIIPTPSWATSANSKLRQNHQLRLNQHFPKPKTAEIPPRRRNSSGDHYCQIASKILDSNYGPLNNGIKVKNLSRLIIFF